MMNINRSYNKLVGLLPVIYLIHNLEEWFLFRLKISEIVKAIPLGLKGSIGNDQHFLITLFGVAIVIATAIPFVFAIFIWNKPTILNAKILFVAGLITLVNGISHISSSFMFGSISPGFITGVTLCIPFGIITVEFFRRNFTITLRNYLLLGFLAIGIFIVGLVSIWGLAYLAISLF